MEHPYAKEVSFAPDALERDQIFEQDGPPPAYLYCIHCERAYERGFFRKQDDLQMCPYEGCDGDAVIDAWRWSDIADDQNPSYPEVPVLGKTYPMYGERS